MTSWHRLGRFGLVLGTLALSACGFGPRVPLAQVAFQVAPQANNNAPVAVDLVLTADEDRTDQVLALTAAEWFAKKDQLLRDYPGELSVTSFELVPGQSLPVRSVERPWPVAAAVLFANYQTPGAHRIRFSDQEDALILLGERDATLQP